MRARSARFDRVIGSSHEMAVRVDVLYNGRVIIGGEGQPGLNIVTGDVTYDRTAAILARCQLKVAEPTRLPTLTDGGPLSPYGYELQVWRGINYADGTQELMSLGVFPIQHSNFDGVNLTGDIECLDRAKRVEDAKFEQPYELAAGINIGDAIRALIDAGVPGLEYAFETTPYPTPAVVFFPADGRWAAARALAKAAGCEVYFDGYGRCVMRSEPGAQSDPVLVVAEGGTLTAVTLDLDREPASNRVIVTGENSSNAEVYRGVATDDNPASPTFYDGPFGRKPMFYPSPHIGSDDQAAAVAAALLTAVAGVARSLNLSMVPNPALEPGDVIQTTRTTLGIDELYILDGFTIGLTADAVMGIAGADIWIGSQVMRARFVQAVSADAPVDPPEPEVDILAWEGFDLGESGEAPNTSNTTADSVNGTPGTLFLSDLVSLDGGQSLHVIGADAEDIRFEHPIHITHKAKWYYHHKSTPGETAWQQYLYAEDGTTLGNRFGVNSSGAFIGQVGTAGATDTANFSLTTGKWYKIDQVAVASGTTRWAIYDEAHINNLAEIGASDVVVITNTATSWSDERIGLLNTLTGGSSIPANLTDEGFEGTNGVTATTSNTSADSQSGTAATTTFNTGYFKEGTSGYRVNGTANRILTWLNATHSAHRTSIYFKFTTGPTGALGTAYHYAVKTGDNSAPAFQVGINTADKITGRNGNSGTGDSAVTLGTALASGTEYRLDVYADVGGPLQLDLFTAGNQDGSTPTQTGTTVDDLTAADFGREQLGLIADVSTAVDITFDRFKSNDTDMPSPVGGGSGAPVEYYIEEYRSNAVSMPPNLVVVINDDPGGDTTVSSKLVPAVGCWFGAATPSSTSLGTDAVGLAEWIAATGRRPDILHFYKTALNWTGPTNAERQMLEPAGQPRAIPLYNWKFFNGTTPLAIANGSNDANIVQLAQNLSNYPYQFMLNLGHEWDNDGGRNGSTAMSDANYIAGWRHVVTLMKANNRGNLVFVWNQTGSANNAGNLAGEWWNVMYPGDDVVDWIAYDPYKQNNTGKLDFAGLVNHNVGNTANGYQGVYWWAQTYHPSRPIMMAEWGTWMTDGHYTDAGACTPAQAAAWINTIDDQIEDFPMLKAMVHFNTKKEHDNRIQMSGREAVAAAMETVGQMSYLNVGTVNAP